MGLYELDDDLVAGALDDMSTTFITKRFDVLRAELFRQLPRRPAEGDRYRSRLNGKVWTVGTNEFEGLVLVQSEDGEEPSRRSVSDLMNADAWERV